MRDIRMTAQVLCIAVMACVTANAVHLIGVSEQQAVPPASRHRFILVSGPGYEGAIVSAGFVPAAWKVGRTKDFWTPDSKQVEQLEAHLQRYLRKALQDPNAVTPRPAVSGAGGDDGTNLRWLVERLGQFRRQYYGVIWADQRGIQAFGFLESDITADWRDRIIINADGGCGNWWAEFAASDGRVLSLVCQPTPRPSA